MWKSHILYSVTFSSFLSKVLSLYEIMWKNIVERGRPQITIWRTLVACWIPKSTNTESEYVTLTALPLQQCLHERSSMLSYTYIACLCFHQQQYTHPSFHPNFTISGFGIHWMTKNYHKTVFWCLNNLNNFRRRGTANALRAVRFAVRIPAEIKDFFFPESFMPALGLPILLVSRYRRTFRG